MARSPPALGPEARPGRDPGPGSRKAPPGCPTASPPPAPGCIA